MYGVDIRIGARRLRAGLCAVANRAGGGRLLATVFVGAVLVAGLVPGVARATGPVVTTDSGSASFVAGDNTTSTPVVVDAGLTVTGGSGLTSGTVSITNFRAEDRLAFANDGSTMGNSTGSYNSAVGVLTLTAASGITPAQFQAALRAVTYTDIAVTPDTTTRTLSFEVTDGSGTSSPATRTVTVADTDQTPVVTTTGGSVNYVGGDPAVTIDSAVTVSDGDNTTQSSATVSIAGGFHSGDTLEFANTSATLYGNIDVSPNLSTDLTLISFGATATDAQWANALSAVTFSAASTVPAGDRTISFVTNDGTKDSAGATDTVQFTAVAPGAPTGVSAMAGDGEATVSWSAPGSNGGAPITSYTVTASPGGATASGTASPITVTGLSDGTSYTFTVVATNSAGTSGSSTASTAVTPAAPPGAPTGVSAVAADGQATVSFTAPSSNGSAITSYTVTVSPGGATATASAGPITITGLTNGTAYTFTVTATNAVGTGSASAASNIITPTPAASALPAPTPEPTPTPIPARAPVPDTGAPSPPAGLAGSFTGGVLRLSWQVASDNVGVDHYELYLDNAPLERIAGSETQASIRTFEPTGSSVYTVRAFDAAGNQSAVITAVTIIRTERPNRIPSLIPRWGWQLLAWQQHDPHGARPKTPAKLPAWYAGWKTWREHPFQLAA